MRHHRGNCANGGEYAVVYVTKEVGTLWFNVADRSQWKYTALQPSQPLLCQIHPPLRPPISAE
jgi:hypothetical protein